MGLLGELFPGPKILDEAGEAGDGQKPWRLGPIDLENGVVQVHRTDAAPPASDETSSPRDAAGRTAK